MLDPPSFIISNRKLDKSLVNLSELLHFLISCSVLSSFLTLHLIGMPI